MKLSRNESPEMISKSGSFKGKNGSNTNNNNILLSGPTGSKTGDFLGKNLRKQGNTLNSLENSQISGQHLSDNSRMNAQEDERGSSIRFSTPKLNAVKNTVLTKKKIEQEDNNLKKYLNDLGKQIMEDEKEFLPIVSNHSSNNCLSAQEVPQQRRGRNNLNSTTIMNKFNQLLLLEKLGMENNMNNMGNMGNIGNMGNMGSIGSLGNKNKIHPKFIFSDQQTAKSMSPVKKPRNISINSSISNSIRKDSIPIGNNNELMHTESNSKRNSKQNGRKYSTEKTLPLPSPLLIPSANSTPTQMPITLFPKRVGIKRPFDTFSTFFEKNTDNILMNIDKEEGIVKELTHLQPHKLSLLDEPCCIETKQVNKARIDNDDDCFMPKTKESGDEEERISLKRYDNVYDSFEDAENEENLDILMQDYMEEDPFVFRRNSPFLRHWSTLVFLLILYSVTVSPYFIAFYEIEGNGVGSIDAFIDILFILDVIINFFSPYYDSEGDLVTNHKKIISNYLMTYFAFDLLSSFPTGFFSLMSSEGVDDLDLSSNKVGSFKKFIRLSRLYRLTKWLKVFRLLKLAKKKDHSSEDDSLELVKNLEMNRMVVFSCLFVIVMHVSNCLWIYIGKIDEGVVNWINTNEFSDYDNFTLYISGMYFIICTVCSIGYGDITSINTVERVYNIIFMLVGVVLFSFWLSSLSSLFSKLDAKALNLQNKFRILEEIKKEYKIPRILLDKIKKTISHEVKKTNIERYEFIESLPTSVKNEIFLTMHKHHIKQLNFFKNQPHDFILYVLPLFKPLPITKGETLFSIGEFVQEIYLVVKGSLSLNMGSMYDYIEIAQIRQGNHIGDVLLYLNDQSPYDLKCKTDNSEVFVIKRNDFVKIKQHFYQNILYILKNSMKAMELFEKRRLIVQHFRKFEIDPKLIFQKMKTLNLMLMNKDFDEYFYNEGELQDINDFIESVDSEELMKFLGIDVSKIDKFKSRKTEVDINYDDEYDEKKFKHAITLTEKPGGYKRQSEEEEKDLIEDFSEKKDEESKHVKFNLTADSENSNNTIVNMRKNPKSSNKNQMNKSISSEGNFDDSPLELGTSKNISALINPWKSNDDSTSLLMPDNNNSILDQVNKRVSTKFSSKKETPYVPVKKRGSSFKVKKDDKKSQVKKIVNEILLVNQWGRGFGYNGNEAIAPENNIESKDKLQIPKESPTLVRKKSNKGELNFDAIKNELKINEKAGNLISNIGDNMHIQKIKSDIAELGNTKKMRRKSISILNNLTNNLAGLKDGSNTGTNKERLRERFTSSRNLNLTTLPNNTEINLDSEQSKRKSNMKITQVPEGLNNPNYTFNNNIIDTNISLSNPSASNIKDSNIITDAKTLSIPVNNPSISINFYQLETNYNHNYIFLEDKKNDKSTIIDLKKTSSSHFSPNIPENPPSPVIMINDKPIEMKKVSEMKLTHNVTPDTLDISKLIPHDVTNDINDITIHTNNNLSFNKEMNNCNTLSTLPLHLNGINIFKYGIEMKKFEKGYKKLDRLYYLLQKMNVCVNK